MDVYLLFFILIAIGIISITTYIFHIITGM